MVPKNNFALSWPDTPAPACIGIAPPCVPTATAVPSSELCLEKPPQYLGPSRATTAPAPDALPASAAVTFRSLISPASEAAAFLLPTSPCAEISSDSLGPASKLTAPALAPAHLESDLLLTVARDTSSTIQSAPCLNSFLVGKQLPTLSPPPYTVNHLALPMLKEYAELGCPAAVGPAWPLNTNFATIATGPHASTLTPEATAFCRQELLEQAQRGFRIILLVDMALMVFGMSPVKSLLRSIVIGCPFAPKCRWTTCLRTRRTQLSR